MKKITVIVAIIIIIFGLYSKNTFAKYTKEPIQSTQGEELDKSITKLKPTKEEKLQEKERRNKTKNYFKQKRKIQVLTKKKEIKEKKIEYLKKRLDNKEEKLKSVTQTDED